MLYYLMLVPAVLSTAVIYFLSPALSYWWLLPVLLGCFVAANLVYVLLMFVCSLFAGPNRMYDRISPFYLALTLALDGWILALCRIKIHVEGLEKVPTDSEFLFVSNHRSNFDPMVQWWVLRRWPLAFVSKPSNMRKFVIGPFVRRCCFLPIDRENARNALTTINAAANLIRAHVCSFAIYPEGPRRQGRHDQRAHGGYLRQNARRTGKIKKRRTEHSSAKCGRVFFHFIGRTIQEMHMNFLHMLSFLIHFCQRP